MLVGTVAYLPPEQALGRASDARSDLYSLGAMLYELLTGEPPFPGEDAVGIIGRHLNADPVAPSRHRPEIPAALDEVVLGLLAKAPDDRPQSAADARRAIETAASAPAGARAAGARGEPARIARARGLRRPRLRARADARAARGRAGGPGPAAASLRRSRDRQDAHGRAARNLRAGAWRSRALGPLPGGRGPAAVLALVGGTSQLRPRRGPGGPAVGARQSRRRRCADRA